MKNKIPFNSRKKAMEELNRILNTNFNVCKCIKPSRIYEYQGQWFLTSKPTITTY